MNAPAGIQSVAERLVAATASLSSGDIPAVPQVRGVVAPPAIPKKNVAYWEDVFRRLTRTDSWRKFLADNQFEDGYQNSTELVKFYDEFTDRMRGILQEAGIKLVR